jgi:NAD(P)-dependent dehydrogenase (short-subunit alcohol dehydrogenase family)
VIAANLLPAVRLGRLLMPGMRTHRSVIIHVSASTARQPSGQIAHYAPRLVTTPGGGRSLVIAV